MTTTSAAAAFSAAPAAAPAASAAPAPTPGTTPAPTAPAANGQWFDSFENPDVKTWTAAKGFKDPAALAESAWNLEKLIGFDKAGRTLVVPKEDASPEEMRAFFGKLGVPESPDGYQLPVPQGADPEFAKQAAQWMHEAGVPPKQAAMLAEKWNGYVAEMTGQMSEAQSRQAATDFAKVTAEWGSESSANLELGKRAAAAFIPAASADERAGILSKIEAAMGTGPMLKMFASIGRGLGEARVVDGGSGSGGGFGMSAEQAQAKITSLKNDKVWTAAYINGDPAKKAEFQQLFAIAYPGA